MCSCSLILAIVCAESILASVSAVDGPAQRLNSWTFRSIRDVSLSTSQQSCSLIVQSSSLISKMLSFNFDLETYASFSQSVFASSTTVYSTAILSSMPSRIVDLATPWQFIQSLKAAFSVAVAFAAGSSSLSWYPLMITFTCFCSRSRAISVAHCAEFMPLNLVMVMVDELILYRNRHLSQSLILYGRHPAAAVRHTAGCGVIS